MLTRRNFFRTATAAAAASFVLPDLAGALEPQRTNSPAGPVQLNSNEYAYGPWASALDAMRGVLTEANRYPNDRTGELVATIAQLHNVKPTQVILGCGSSQILQMVANVYCPGAYLVQASPSYEAMARHGQASGAKGVVYMPLNELYEHPLAAMLKYGGNTVFYICNPNNPTASITPRMKIDEFISKASPNSIIFIDEAYHHFATHLPDYVSYLDKPLNDPRVIVTRTFSKIHGLAGIRAGYAVASEDVIKRLRPFSTFMSVNNLAVAACTAVLKDADGLAKAKRQTDADRDEFLRHAKQRNLSVIPSAANFAMLDTKRPIRQVIDHFGQNGIQIGRPFPPYETHARISFGTPAEMTKFWQAWDKMGQTQTC